MNLGQSSCWPHQIIVRTPDVNLGDTYHLLLNELYKIPIFHRRMTWALLCFNSQPGSHTLGLHKLWMFHAKFLNKIDANLYYFSSIVTIVTW